MSSSRAKGLKSHFEARSITVIARFRMIYTVTYTEIVPRRSVLSRNNEFLRHTRKRNVIYAYERCYTFPLPITTK